MDIPGFDLTYSFTGQTEAGTDLIESSWLTAVESEAKLKAPTYPILENDEHFGHLVA